MHWDGSAGARETTPVSPLGHGPGPEGHAGGDVTAGADRPGRVHAASILAVVAFATGAGALVGAAPAAAINDIIDLPARPGRVLVVDDDRQQCPQADHSSVQRALDVARDGDRVRVCPGRYPEQLTVRTSVSLVGQVGATASVDCLDPTVNTLGDLDPTRFAILEPDPATGAEPTTHVRIQADGVELAGFAVQGLQDESPEQGPTTPLYDAAISVSDAHAGTWIHHDLIRLNTLGVELGGNGQQLTRLDHNCLRDNTWAVANQRFTLTHARIDDNTTFRTSSRALELVLPGSTDVAVDHNVFVDPEAFQVIWVADSTRPRVEANEVSGSRSGIVLRDSTDAVVTANEVQAGGGGIAVTGTSSARVVGNDVTAGAAGVGIGGGNLDLEVAGNVLTGAAQSGGQVGIQTVPPGVRPASEGLVISGNTVTGWRGAPGTGILLNPGTTVGGALVADNVVSGNAGEGLAVEARNNGLHIHRNTANDNGANGIRVAAGALSNVLTDNTALRNDTDARDGGLLADGVTPTSNEWVRTTCVTDVPDGICTTPTAGDQREQVR